MLENSRDSERTAAAGFLDRRSYISQAGLEYLYGADASARRHEVYLLAGGRCARCNTKLTEEYGELDHIHGGLGPQRNWSLANLQWLCRRCHRAKHKRDPQWSAQPAFR